MKKKNKKKYCNKTTKLTLPEARVRRLQLHYTIHFTFLLVLKKNKIIPEIHLHSGKYNKLNSNFKRRLLSHIKKILLSCHHIFNLTSWVNISTQ